MMDLLFHVQTGGIFEIFKEEIDVVRIALSCHFALDLLRDKAGAHDSALRLTWHHCPWRESYLLWHHCHSPDIDVLKDHGTMLRTPYLPSTRDRCGKQFHAASLA